MGRRVLIVGGVAAGASCAARVRRLDESAEIIVFERGPYVSFANCGLPYYVGNVIADERKLLLATPELFQQRFRIEVRTESEVVALDREGGRVEVRERRSGRAYREPFDALVLATGAAPVRPPIPGVDLPGVFVLRTIPDSRKIRHWIEEHGVRRAVIVGAGLVGVEMAENLHRRRIEVTMLEMLDQVLPPFDPEMARPMLDRLRENGITVRLGDAVSSLRAEGGTLRLATRGGAEVAADLVILSVGVRPESQLARDAGLALGAGGAVAVDESMRTSDPRIWAVGDVAEVRDVVTGALGSAALAGPANRQGRIAADSLCGRPARFRGVQGTAVCGAFGLTAACTGAAEKSLKRTGAIEYHTVYLHPGNHVSYYPGARPIHMKIVFRKDDGRVLGAQAVGEEGVEKRIDVLACAIQLGATVYDLEEAELCYAPQFGAAKDPVNLAGMVAANVLRGDLPLADWALARNGGDGPAGRGPCLLDVRDPEEYAAGHLEGAVNIPLPQLRERMHELPGDRDLLVCCAVGQRAYYATRALLQHGYRARMFPGGWKTWRCLETRREE